MTAEEGGRSPGRENQPPGGPRSPSVEAGRDLDTPPAEDPRRRDRLLDVSTKDAFDTLVLEGTRAVLRAEARRGKLSEADRIRGLTTELLVLTLHTLVQLVRAHDAPGGEPGGPDTG